MVWGKKICSKQIGETEYSLRLFPLGGFCRLHGETEEGEITERSFLAKSVWARMAIMAAGPIMNFLLAIILIFGLSASGYIIQPKVAAVLDGSPAQEIGLQEGDEIYRINGDRIHIYDEMQAIMLQNGGEPIDLEIKRDGMIYEYELTPQYSEETQSYLVGFTPTIKNGIFAGKSRRLRYSERSGNGTLQLLCHAELCEADGGRLGKGIYHAGISG